MKFNLGLIFTPIIILHCFTHCQPKGNINDSQEYEAVEINSNWFTVSYLAPKTYIIEESKSSQHNVSYLILGDNKAIMFDTGSGENAPVNGLKIKTILQQITDLPIHLLLSHFHFDHNQNIEEFDYILFPKIEFLQDKVGTDHIYHFSEEDLFWGDFPKNCTIDEWYPLNSNIDIGNKLMQVVHVPGHSKESVALIDNSNKVAFLGDFLYNGALFVFSPADLLVYEASVNTILTVLDSDYKLYGAHGKPEVEFSKLQKLKNMLTCINSGECGYENSVVWGKDVYIYTFEGMQLVLFY